MSAARPRGRLARPPLTLTRAAGVGPHTLRAGRCGAAGGRGERGGATPLPGRLRSVPSLSSPAPCAGHLLERGHQEPQPRPCEAGAPDLRSAHLSLVAPPP